MQGTHAATIVMIFSVRRRARTEIDWVRLELTARENRQRACRLPRPARPGRRPAGRLRLGLARATWPPASRAWVASWAHADQRDPAAGSRARWPPASRRNSHSATPTIASATWPPPSRHQEYSYLPLGRLPPLRFSWKRVATSAAGSAPASRVGKNRKPVRPLGSAHLLIVSTQRCLLLARMKTRSHHS
jgi:hypothetical protein